MVQLAKRVTQGDTFKAGLTVTRTIDGITSPVNLTGVTIASEVRDEEGTLVGTLTIIPVDLLNGQFTVRGETVGWPEGIHEWDVEFIENGDTWSTPKRGVHVEGDVTNRA